jgi:hypothetical protein
MSRAFSSLAMSPKELAPAALMPSITGARSAARASADADRASRALAQSAAVPGRPRKPPSRLPRALAAARAERVPRSTPVGRFTEPRQRTMAFESTPVATDLRAWSIRRSRPNLIENLLTTRRYSLVAPPAATACGSYGGRAGRLVRD